MALRNLILSLGCLLLICVFVTACPPENIVRPCSCDHSSLVCSGITEQSVLEGVFRRLGNIHLEEFILLNSRVDHLVASTVEKNLFRRIRVIDSSLVNFFDQTPPSHNKLSQLRIENTTVLNGLEVSHLKPLEELELLIIEGTVVPKLGQEFSMNLSSKIKIVVLRNTETKSIEDAFVGKAELQDVIVQNNLLTSIKRFTFPYPSRKLRRIILDNNKIERLDDDQFTLMSGLRIVSLADNRISQVSKEVFEEVYDQLKVINLKGNPLKCDCTIQWLTRKNTEGKTIKGVCAEPPSLAGKSIVDLKPSDFESCPV